MNKHANILVQHCNLYFSPKTRYLAVRITSTYNFIRQAYHSRAVNHCLVFRPCGPDGLRNHSLVRKARGKGEKHWHTFLVNLNTKMACYCKGISHFLYNQPTQLAVYCGLYAKLNRLNARMIYSTVCQR